ncbi:CsgE family curli-type amyloid fiber assembly protein [Ascidiimonas aurantiaca]|uniref:CsgE family curli-type amyloid fiber assembly protein n=1 Tax=Ascidiimonas aurantiaca TaxID=1685432 RepID=UPI0030EBFEA9
MISAELDTDQTDRGYKVRALVKNDSPIFKSLSYELAIIKSFDDTARERSSSKDNFSIEPGEVKALKEVFVAFENESKIIVLLLISEDDKIIANSRKVFLNEDLIKNKTIPANDGIEIKGLVIDNVVSKIGKDFYDIFYRQYQLQNLRSSSMVTIEEQLGIGLGARIIIKVDNDIVFEGFATPGEEYINNMANATVKKVVTYLEQKEKQKKYITQY